MIFLGIRSVLCRSAGSATDGPRCAPQSHELLTAVVDLFLQCLPPLLPNSLYQRSDIMNEQ